MHLQRVTKKVPLTLHIYQKWRIWFIMAINDENIDKSYAFALAWRDVHIITRNNRYTLLKMVVLNQKFVGVVH